MNFNNYNELITYLKSISDQKYAIFNQKIINTNKEIIGVKIPILRKLINKVDANTYEKILKYLKNTYFEESIIEGLIIANIKDQRLFDLYFDKFIHKVDNWATCDICIANMKSLAKNEKYFDLATSYLSSNQEFIERIGYIMIMDHFLDDNHIDKIFTLIDNNPSTFYYSQMAKAWLLSICFCKYRHKTLNYLNNNKLDNFTYNKTLQKILESRKITDHDRKIIIDMKRNTK